MLSPAWAKVLFGIISLGGLGGVVSVAVLNNIWTRGNRKESCSEWLKKIKGSNDALMCIEVKEE